MGEKYDLFIIGGGPGGYTAAAAAAEKGMSVALAEDIKLGGTCLNRGCIPTKTLMHSSEFLRKFQAGVPGISGTALCDMKALQERRQAVSDELSDNIEKMLKKSKIVIYNGKAQIISQHEIQMSNSDADNVIEAEKIIIATGSKPLKLHIPGSDLEGVMTSDELIISDKIPERLVIVGGGVIGIELATVYNGLGAKVTIVEGTDRLLAPLDKEYSQSIKMVMKKRNIEIFTGSMLNEIKKSADGSLECCFSENVKGESTEKSLSADVILLALGRIPQTEGLFSEEFAKSGLVQVNEKGYIVSDEKMMTSCPDIYAIGDVTGGIQLAHVAQAQAYNVINIIANTAQPQSLSVIPGCVYTDPEIAYCGITADEAKKSGLNVITKKYPMSANGKSLLSQQERGFIKIVADAETGKLLGAQMMCGNAVDMISEFAAAIVNGLTISDMGKVVRPHPSFSEGISEVLRNA